MGQHPNRLPDRRALEMARAICDRLDGVERDELKAYAAMLVARHVISKARRHANVSRLGVPVDTPLRRKL